MNVFEILEDVRRNGLIPERLTDTNIPDRCGNIIKDGMKARPLWNKLSSPK